MGPQVRLESMVPNGSSEFALLHLQRKEDPCSDVFLDAGRPFPSRKPNTRFPDSGGLPIFEVRGEGLGRKSG